MIIGSFEYDAKRDTYLGDIVTPGFSIQGVAFKPTKKKSDREPDYRVTAPTAIEHVELGGGWRRTSDRGNEFISVTLDGPLLSAPLNAALFDDGDNKASLVWSRPRGKAKPDSE